MAVARRWLLDGISVSASTDRAIQRYTHVYFLILAARDRYWFSFLVCALADAGEFRASCNKPPLSRILCMGAYVCVCSCAAVAIKCVGARMCVILASERRVCWKKRAPRELAVDDDDDVDVVILWCQ